MRRNKLYLILLSTLFALLITIGSFIYIEKFSWSNKNQIRFMKKELEALVTYWITPDNPMREYLIGRINKSLSFLDDRKTIEKPHIVYCCSNVSHRDNNEESVDFMFNWLEIGFNSLGINIYFSKNDVDKNIKIPFPLDMWNKDSKKRYRQTTLRVFTAKGKIEDNYINLDLVGKGGLYSTVKLPLSVITEPALVTIYDNKGNESEPIGLFILPELRELISHQKQIGETVLN